MSDVQKFVEFLRTKFRSANGPNRHYDNHDLAWSSSLIEYGTGDTQGDSPIAVDYTELLRRIDEFAAEFEAKQKNQTP